MKKLFVGIIVFAICWCSLSCTSYACSKTPGCAATLGRVECGHVNGSYGHHYVVESAEYHALCSVTVVEGPHTIYCAGCGAVLSNNEYRRCSETHSYYRCPVGSQYGMCKY